MAATSSINQAAKDLQVAPSVINHWINQFTEQLLLRTEGPPSEKDGILLKDYEAMMDVGPKSTIAYKLLKRRLDHPPKMIFWLRLPPIGYQSLWKLKHSWIVKGLSYLRL